MLKCQPIVGILIFISMINTSSERLKQEASLFACIFVSWPDEISYSVEHEKPR